MMGQGRIHGQDFSRLRFSCTDSIFSHPHSVAAAGEKPVYRSVQFILSAGRSCSQQELWSRACNDKGQPLSRSVELTGEMQREVTGGDDYRAYGAQSGAM